MLNQNKYPIYVISKGRWDNRKTISAFDAMGVDYRLVIEPQEFKQYSLHVDKSKILVLPFSNLGQGSIPARNWVWEHSLGEGAARHWIVDDNISQFSRLYNNTKIQVKSPVFFRAMEDFVDRYSNVALAGPQYFHFAKSDEKVPPFLINTRIYSCILIDNALNERWRGRFNEDTDLSLRLLKQGYCTILFYAFLIGKVTTLTMRGGNTDEVYKDTNRRLEFAKSLQDQHPDVVEIVWKWNRWHHKVDYSPFKNNRLIKRDNINVSDEPNNYGMKLIERN